MFARPFIDSIDFARNGGQLSGEIQIVNLSRLSDLLSNSNGALNYRVVGLKEGGLLKLEITLEGMCYLRCQRCLGELGYPIELKSQLQLLSAEKLDELDDEDEEAIEATKRLDVLALIEDELLLSLPFAPKHPVGKCVAPENDVQLSANPFAALAVLKK